MGWRHDVTARLRALRRGKTQDAKGDDSPVELHTSENWVIGRRVGADDYRFGAYMSKLNERTIWRISPDQDLTCTRVELAELHALLGRVLAGEKGEPYPAPGK